MDGWDGGEQGRRNWTARSRDMKENGQKERNREKKKKERGDEENERN